MLSHLIEYTEGIIGTKKWDRCCRVLPSRASSLQGRLIACDSKKSRRILQKKALEKDGRYHDTEDECHDQTIRYNIGNPRPMIQSIPIPP